MVDGATQVETEWQADRTLATGLLGYIQEQLTVQGKSWHDVSGIGAFKGPGSFTGLRIGLTVLNTAADALEVPIIGSVGDGWKKDVLMRLEAGENDRIILPEYGSEAHITKPRK
ncbi:tRNA threonylcarbamoyladenosine biosynthesis protein TsaB [compost metagenome]